MGSFKFEEKIHILNRCDRIKYDIEAIRDELIHAQYLEGFEKTEILPILPYYIDFFRELKANLMRKLPPENIGKTDQY